MKIITSASIPPYVISTSDSGIVTQVIKEAFALQGDQVRFIYSTNKRLREELMYRRVDGAFNFPAGKLPDFYYSDSIIEYQNVVVTLKRRNLKIQQVQDLQSQRVIAFQNSALFLGPDYGAMAKANPRHEEVSDQKSQVLMLFSGRADAIVLDQRIFHFYLRQLRDQKLHEEEFEIHPIFPLAPRYAVFGDRQLRDRFNAGLARLRESGRYDAILKNFAVATPLPGLLPASSVPVHSNPALAPQPALPVGETSAQITLE